MNELIKTESNENGEVIVSGCELHSFLEVTERYNSWINRMLAYGFVENEDFTSVKTFTVVNNGAERELDNHAMKLDMAKQIAMIQRNDKGKQAREYFLHLEKLWNSPEKVMERALQFAKQQVKKAEERIFGLETKVEKLVHSSKVYTATEIGKELGMSGTALNKFLVEKGIQYKVNGTYVLKAQYEGKNYTSIKQGEYNGKIIYDRRFTGEGRQFILGLFKEVIINE